VLGVRRTFFKSGTRPGWAGNDRGKSNILRNMGALVSGDLGKPLLDADALLIEDGLR